MSSTFIIEKKKACYDYLIFFFYSFICRAFYKRDKLQQQHRMEESTNSIEYQAIEIRPSSEIESSGDTGAQIELQATNVATEDQFESLDQPETDVHHLQASEGQNEKSEEAQSNSKDGYSLIEGTLRSDISRAEKDAKMFEGKGPEIQQLSEEPNKFPSLALETTSEVINEKDDSQLEDKSEEKLSGSANVLENSEIDKESESFHKVEEEEEDMEISEDVSGNGGGAPVEIRITQDREAGSKTVENTDHKDVSDLLDIDKGLGGKGLNSGEEELDEVSEEALLADEDNDNNGTKGLLDEKDVDMDVQLEQSEDAELSQMSPTFGNDQGFDGFGEVKNGSESNSKSAADMDVELEMRRDDTLPVHVREKVYCIDEETRMGLDQTPVNHSMVEATSFIYPLPPKKLFDLDTNTKDSCASDSETKFSQNTDTEDVRLRNTISIDAENTKDSVASDSVMEGPTPTKRVRGYREGLGDVLGESK